MTPAQIIAMVAAEYNVTADDITGICRRHKFARPRHIVFLLLRERGASFPAIGKRMHRDHSTIMHGVSAIKTRVANDFNLAVTVEKIRLKIERNPA